MGIPPITDTHAVFLVLSQLSGAQYVSDCDRRQVAKDSKSFSCSTSRGTGNDKELEDEIESCLPIVHSLTDSSFLYAHFLFLTEGI